MPPRPRPASPTRVPEDHGKTHALAAPADTWLEATPDAWSATCESRIQDGHREAARNCAAATPRRSAGTATAQLPKRPALRKAGDGRCRVLRLPSSPG